MQDFDIQSRAAAAIADEWQKPDTAVDAIWGLGDLIELIVAAAENAREAYRTLANRDAGPEPDGNGQHGPSATEYTLESLQRLKAAADGTLHLIESSDTKANSIERFSELRECAARLPQLVADFEALVEAVEWQELERTAMPSDRIRAVADYLKSTGQASA